MIKHSELILNPDGSVYHLNIRPEHVASKIITVGDPDRVDEVTKYFDTVTFTTQKREFKTTTGRCNGVDLTVISTGIGTDNIDIVLNELDALFNIDLDRREIKDTISSIDIFRIGTSGSMREEIPIDSYVMSAYGVGLDGLMHFYEEDASDAEADIRNQASAVLIDILPGVKPYLSSGNPKLLERFKSFCIPGITVTAAGFYAPQGRELRLKPRATHYLDTLKNIRYQDIDTTNFEMETAGIYGLAQKLGHRAISLNAIVANRVTGQFSQDSQKTIDTLIQKSLEVITA